MKQNDDLMGAFSDDEWASFKSMHSGDKTIGFAYSDNSNLEQDRMTTLRSVYMTVDQYDKYRKEHIKGGDENE